jgi:hypothetical protein
MMLDPYHLALGDSTRLKLRASAMLAEGASGAEYQAALLFHEAARAEARALAALPAPSAETRLRSAIERCGCLVDGRDPSAVIEVAWPEVLTIADEVPAPLARSLRSRIDEAIAGFLREYRVAITAAPDLLSRIQSPGTFSARAARQLEQLLRAFPGDPRLWTMKALNAVGDDDDVVAVDCARRARALLLDEAMVDGIEGLAPGIEVISVARSFAIAEAETSFDAGYTRVRFGSPGSDFCFALIAAGLVLVERSGEGTDRIWERIAEIAAKGSALPDVRTRPYGPFFRAAKMIASESLAKRRPSLDILYRVGLGAAASRSQSTNPVAILSAEMTGRVLRSAA